MSMSKKVSVVILIYMVEEYVEKCIKSVCNQTFNELEIILAVRRGEDHSFEICERCAAGDTRIKIVDRQGKTRGQGRNEGMRVATGDYILFVDGDDWMEPTMIERLVSSIEEYQADAAICGDIYENEDDQKGGVKHIAALPKVFNRESFYRELLTRKTFGVEVWNKLYRFSKIKDIAFGDEQAEDRFWSNQVFERLDVFTYVPSAEFHYVIRGNSGSRKPHVMESSMQADCILVENIKKHGYLMQEASYYLFCSCYAAVYAALHFDYFSFDSCETTYETMKNLWKDVVRYPGARKQDKVKALLTGLGFHPLIWFVRTSIRLMPAGLFDETEEK